MKCIRITAERGKIIFDFVAKPSERQKITIRLRRNSWN